MANSTKTNPLVLDTAGVVLTGPVSIRAIRVIYGADDDDVSLSDSKGNSVFLGKATHIESAGNSESLTIPGCIKVDGLTATTIDSGSKVYVYLK